MLATKEVFLTSPKWDFWNNQVSANPYKLPRPEQPSTETETGPGYLTPELDIGQPFSREDNGMKIKFNSKSNP